MPSAVAGVIEISRWLRVITITTANADGHHDAQRVAAQAAADPSEPPTMMATPASAAAIAIQVRGGIALAHQQPRQQRRQEGRDRLEQQHVRDARVRRARG